MVRTLPLQPATLPEPARILAIATAIAVHAFAFLLLLLPLAQSLPGEPPEMVVQPIWVLPKVVEPTPLPPAPVEPRPLPPVTPAPRIAVVPLQPPAPMVFGTAAFPIAVGAQPAAGPVAEQATDSAPVAGVALAYAYAPAPPYPRAAIRDGAQGTVLLMILVDTDGKPLQVTLHRSSGNRVLDRAALEHVARHWRFQPALRNGQPVQAYGVVPIAFSMQ